MTPGPMTARIISSRARNDFHDRSIGALSGDV
jgi:hypothetical protein